MRSSKAILEQDKQIKGDLHKGTIICLEAIENKVNISLICVYRWLVFAVKGFCVSGT